MNRVLFVCTENSNRSQMGEAFSRMHAAGAIEPASAGSAPSGIINPVAIEAMSERGYDLTTHRSKGLAGVGDGPWDYVITMGCGDACPWVASRHREDWRLADPAGMSLEELRAVRDEIETRVLELKARVECE
jgi:protein-tyrosine-phosphatase